MARLPTTHHVYFPMLFDIFLSLSWDYKFEVGNCSSLYLPPSLARVLQIRGVQTFFCKVYQTKHAIAIRDFNGEAASTDKALLLLLARIYGYIFNLHTDRQAPNAIRLGVVGTNRHFFQLIQDVFFKKIGLSEPSPFCPIYFQEVVGEKKIYFLKKNLI